MISYHEKVSLQNKIKKPSPERDGLRYQDKKTGQAETAEGYIRAPFSSAIFSVRYQRAWLS